MTRYIVKWKEDYGSVNTTSIYADSLTQAISDVKVVIRAINGIESHKLNIIGVEEANAKV